MVVGGGGGKWKIDNMEGIRGETELYTFKHVYVEKNRDGEKKEKHQRADGENSGWEVKRGERTGDNNEEQ